MGITVIRKKGKIKIKDLKSFTKELGKKQVTIGMHKEEGKKVVVHTLGREKPSEARLIDIACYNEFGNGSRPPARVFVHIKNDEKFLNELRKIQTDSLEEAPLKGYKNADKMINGLFEQIGEKYLNRMLEHIENSLNYYPSNDQKTIDLKGFDHPLFEEGYLFENLRYKVRRKKND